MFLSMLFGFLHNQWHPTLRADPGSCLTISGCMTQTYSCPVVCAIIAAAPKIKTGTRFNKISLLMLLFLFRAKQVETNESVIDS